jgi:phosphatidylglycerol:prolipoprotein diacylglycerol transferase
MIYLHNLDPIFLDLGFIAIRWYSLAYIFGIILGVSYALFLEKKYVLKITDRQDIEDLSVYIIIGIILGGRLGYVLFYNFVYYAQNIHEIFFIWQGGMSFHGGLIGFTLAVLLYSKKQQKSFLRYMDLMSVIVPIGLFLGRVANFINGELFGKETSGNWGVVFPNAGDFPRHPSQLYEAFLEGLCCFLILSFLMKYKKFRDKTGFMSGIFLLLYACSRIIIENFRVPDFQLGYFFNFITMGQILSIPMLMLGLYLVLRCRKKN